jgi:hypothetical protein
MVPLVSSAAALAAAFDLPVPRPPVTSMTSTPGIAARNRALALARALPLSPRSRRSCRTEKGSIRGSSALSVQAAGGDVSLSGQAAGQTVRMRRRSRSKPARPYI